MPVHNGERYLAAALASTLNDLPTDAELIVVDDASTDQSAKIIAQHAEPRLKVLTHTTSHGISGAINAGAFLAPHREFVAVVEHDDVVMPQRFSVQLAILAQNPEIGVVGCRGRYTDGSGRIFGRIDVGPTSIAEFHRSRRSGEVLLTPHACAMFRFEALHRAGGYDSDFDGAQDIDVMNRIVYQYGYQLLTSSHVGFLYRLHPHATSFHRFRFQRMATRYIRERNKATLAGTNIPDISQWDGPDAGGIRRRFRWWRHDLGALHLRIAALRAVGRHPVSAVAHASTALLLHPTWVVQKLRNQIRTRKAVGHGF